MPAEVFAWIAAACFAGSHVASKRGLETTSVVAGLLISLVVSLAVLLAASLADPPATVRAAPAAVFAASGLLAPALARTSAIAGVRRLGASIAVPVQTSVYPLFAFLGGALLLGEAATPLRLAGVLLIIAGVATLSRATSTATSSEKSGSRRLTRVGLVRGSARALAFPFAAGLFYAAADVVRKEALTTSPEPVFGAMLSVAAALVVWLFAFAIAAPLRAQLKIGQSSHWFATSGALSAAALIALFHALTRGDVSLVSPIIAAQPLMVFALALVLLRQVEQLRLVSLYGAFAVAAGTVLISL